MRANFSDILFFTSRIFLAIESIIPVVSDITKGVEIIGDVKESVNRTQRHYHKRTSDIITNEILDEKIYETRGQAIKLLLEKSIEISVHENWKEIKNINPEDLISFIKERLNYNVSINRDYDIEIIRLTGEDAEKAEVPEIKLCRAINTNFSKLFNHIREENAAVIVEIEDLKNVDRNLKEQIERLSNRLDNLYKPLSTKIPELPKNCTPRYEATNKIASLLEKERIVFLSGEGGSGKTTLAALVAAYLKDSYSIAWLNINNTIKYENERYFSSIGKAFSQSFSQYASPKNSKNLKDYEVRHAFATFLNKGPVFLIIDMNTIELKKEDLTFLIEPHDEKTKKYLPFPYSWRFLILIRKSGEIEKTYPIIDLNKNNTDFRMSDDEIVEQLNKSIKFLNPDYSYMEYLLSDLAEYANGNPLIASHIANEINYYSESTLHPITKLQKRLYLEDSSYYFSRLMNVLNFKGDDSRWEEDLYYFLKLCVILPSDPLSHPYLVFGKSDRAKRAYEVLKNAEIIKEEKRGIICHDEIKNAIAMTFFNTLICTENDKDKNLGLKNTQLCDFLFSLSTKAEDEEESFTTRLTEEIKELKGTDPEILKHKVEPLIMNIFYLFGLLSDENYYQKYEENEYISSIENPERAVGILKLFISALSSFQTGLISKKTIKNVTSFVLLYLKSFSLENIFPYLSEKASFLLSRCIDGKDLGASLKRHALNLALIRMKDDKSAALDASTYVTSYLYSVANSNVSGYDDFLFKFYAIIAIYTKDDIQNKINDEGLFIYETYKKIANNLNILKGTSSAVCRARTIDNFAGSLGSYGYYSLQLIIKRNNYEMMKSSLAENITLALDDLESHYRKGSDINIQKLRKLISTLSYDERDSIAFRLNNYAYSIMDLEFWLDDIEFFSEADVYLNMSKFIYKGLDSENAMINLKALAIYYSRKALRCYGKEREDTLAYLQMNFNSFTSLYSEFARLKKDWFKEDEDFADTIAEETRSIYLEKLYLENKITKEEFLYQSIKYLNTVSKGTTFFRHLKFLKDCKITDKKEFHAKDSVITYYNVHTKPLFEPIFISECKAHKETISWPIDASEYRNVLEKLSEEYIESFNTK